MKMINEIKRRIRILERMKKTKEVCFTARRNGKNIKIRFKLKKDTPYYDGQLQAYRDLLEITKSHGDVQ